MRSKYAMAVGLAVALLMTGFLWGGQAQESDKAPAASVPATAQAPSNPHNYNISAEERDRKNPTRYTELSVARGKKVFETQCAMCHGEKGDGSPDLAKEIAQSQNLTVNMPDFGKPDQLKKRTDGELFKIIGLGNAIMPSQEKRMPDNIRWNIVNFLRSLSGPVPEKATGKELDEYTIEIPAKSTTTH